MRKINFSSIWLVCLSSSDEAQGWRKKHLSSVSDWEHMVRGAAQEGSVEIAENESLD